MASLNLSIISFPIPCAESIILRILIMFLLKLSLIVPALLYLISCAVQKSPGGGPLDRTPPEIEYTNPASDSLGLPLHLERIDLRFSERMDQSSLNNNIYISPPLKFETEWDGWDELTLHLQDSLLPEKTYVVSIGAGARDLQKNSMKESLQFAFSTGTVIDSGSIKGKIFHKEKNKIYNLFAYDLSDSTAFNPLKNKPEYITQSGPSGDFNFTYLQLGRYRIMAVEDQNHNLLVDADYEKIGIPVKDVLLDSARHTASGLNFQLTKSDTTPPAVISLRSVYRTAVQLRLSEPVSLPAEGEYSIVDSLKQQPVNILGFSQDPEKNNIIHFYTDPLDSAARYQLYLKSLEDTSGNISSKLPLYMFSASAKDDTAGFRLLHHSPKDSSKNLSPRMKVSMEFSLPVDTASIKTACILVSAGGDTVSGNWKFPNLFMAEFKPTNFFKPDSSYSSVLNLSELRNLYNQSIADSVSDYYFSIVPAREMGEISGEAVIQSGETAPVHLNVRSLNSRQAPVEIILDRKNTFFVPYMREGKYLIDGFIDLNRDGRFSAGSLLPFKYSEPFVFGRDTIEVRKRWEKSGVRFAIPREGR